MAPMSILSPTSRLPLAIKKVHSRHTLLQSTGLKLIDTEYIASGGNSSLILLHSLSTLSPDPVHTLIGHSLNVSTLQYSPKRQKLISGSWDRTARIWAPPGPSSKEWECVKVLEEHEEAVWGVLAIDSGPEEGGWLTASGTSSDHMRMKGADG